jgi:hypothetical protein
MVFGVCAILNHRFAPRYADLPDQRYRRAVIPGPLPDGVAMSPEQQAISDYGPLEPIAGSAFQLLVDGWPGGQRFTGLVDGQEFFKVLLAITPVDDRTTIQVGRAGTPRFRVGRLRTAANLAMLWGQSRAGTRQDMPVYDTTSARARVLRTPLDDSVIRFRRYYQRWVERANDINSSGTDQ